MVAELVADFNQVLAKDWLAQLVSFQAIAIIYPLSCDQPFNLDQIQIKGDRYDVIDNQTMKTDKLFYHIFLSQPDLISELLPDIPANY